MNILASIIINLLLLIFFVTLFKQWGLIIFLILLGFKPLWQKIQEVLKENKKNRNIIDVDNIKQKQKQKSVLDSFFLSFNKGAMETPSFKTILKGLVVLFILFMLFDGFTSIPAGNVGVVYDRGRGVLQEEFPEGLHLKIPFWQIVEKMDVRTMQYTMSSAPGEGAVFGEDTMTAPTADGQTVSVDTTVLFHIDKERASDLFQTVGTDYVNKIVRPVARGQVRMVISRYTAIDIYSEKRAEAESAMTTDIAKILAEKGIVLERILLRNIAFGTEYAKAIEEKQIAQQRIQKAEYEKLEAEKLKQKKIIEAEADAQAIKLKGETLRANPQVIQFEFVQKMSDNIQWGILPNDILPLVDLKKLSGE